MFASVRTGKLVVNLGSRTVEVDDRPLHLSGKEYDILELFSVHKGRTVTREMLFDHLYGGPNKAKPKTVTVLISNLRKKIAQATGGAHYIETVARCGYVLRDPME
jgi:two-component system cell cycle response regulator CtrA